MRLTVIGLGYLGATHAACMAELGHDVLGIEVDRARLEKLERGELPFFEPGLDELLAKHVESGSLQISDSAEKAAAWGDVHFLAVGTPQQTGDHRADLSQVYRVVRELVPHVKRDAVIIGKSTVPVGTARDLACQVNGLASDVSVEVAWNPEFLREGSAVRDTLSPDRIVLGQAPDGKAEMIVREIYARVLADGVPFIVTDTATAEMVKVASNAFLATKISFINAVAEVCSLAGADVRAVAEAMGHDERIGRQFLNAGIGFGGGCLPKDIRAFMARADELGAAELPTLLRDVDGINMRRRSRVVELARAACGGSFTGARVAVLGAAFKSESDDVRDSPALNIATRVHHQGALVSVYDPKALARSRGIFPELEYVSNITSACEQADVVLVLTDWNEFVSLDPRSLGDVVSGRIVIDGRLRLDSAKWRDAGWEYLS